MDYEECPFCGALFESPTWFRISDVPPIDEHIRSVHKKVKVRKGNKVRWMDAAEAERKVVNEVVEERKKRGKRSRSKRK
jgi:hypothetical protein